MKKGLASKLLLTLLEGGGWTSFTSSQPSRMNARFQARRNQTYPQKYPRSLSVMDRVGIRNTCYQMGNRLSSLDGK
jgi:hypothetical protein